VFSEHFQEPNTSEKMAPKIPVAAAFRQSAPTPQNYWKISSYTGRQPSLSVYFSINLPSTLIRWTVFHQIMAQTPLLRPKLYLPYRELQAIATL
jgi:hypothetical protein